MSTDVELLLKYHHHYNYHSTHRVSVSVFADNVEQVADGPDHDARPAAVSHHRVRFPAARRPVSEHGGVVADQYVFDQAFRRPLVHLVLNESAQSPSIVTRISRKRGDIISTR